MRTFLLYLTLCIVLPNFGGKLNEKVILANHGRMPVWIMDRGTLEDLVFNNDGMHSVMRSTSRYKALADIIPFPDIDGGYLGWDMMSTGDILIYGGEAGWALSPAFAFWLWWRRRDKKRV